MENRSKLQYAIDKWKLTNILPIYEKEDRAVYRAQAAEWGKVILKINNSINALGSEAEVLRVLKGIGYCKLYAFEEQGLLVEEQIFPGTILREEKSPVKRVESFSSVFEKIHVSVEESNIHITYLDWLEKANGFCRENAAMDEAIRGKMQLAYKIGRELFEKYPERVLLHGDLHHDNILKNEKGIYCVIDPKGVIGPEIFDVPRFVLNELSYVEADKAGEHIGAMIQLIAGRLGYCMHDIRKLFFMETMLANVWSMEDGEEVDMHEIEVAYESCNS